MEDDTITVRKDEQLPREALAAYLHGRLPGAVQPPRIRQFGGGAANLTYLLDYGTHQYVLRRPPLGPVAKSAHDMGREYKVLSVLHEAFPYAPRARHFCAETTVIGAPFLIMERKSGVVVRREMPACFQNQPDAARRMSFALVDALADFHSVDYVKLGLADLGKPEGFIARQVHGWYKRWAQAKHEELPLMDELYNWLGANIPPAQRHTLVHNDYKLDNVMFDPGDAGRLTAVFDWDMCTLGDPFSDLGALLTYWVEENDDPRYQMMAMMPPAKLGFPTRAELVARYAEKSGLDVSAIDFYHALGLFRLVVIVAQIYIRYLRGQTQDQRFAALGMMIPVLARMGHDLTQKGTA